MTTKLSPSPDNSDELSNAFGVHSVGGGADAPLFRAPPHNLEAEQALLGALLTSNHSMEKVAEFLRPEHFYNPAHGRIFAAITKLVERGQEASPITLRAVFDSDEDLQDSGGGAYLAELASNVITIINVLDYGRVVHDLYMRRKLIEIGEDLVNTAYQPDLDSSATMQIEVAEKSLYDLATVGDVTGGFVAFHTAIQSAIATAEASFRRESKITGVTTGLIDLDRKMGGLHPSDLIILAGRPSMGKTALATNIAFNAAREHMASGGREGAVAGFYSLEMSVEQLATRVLADYVGISGDRIRRGDVKDNDFPRFVEASQALERLPLFIDDTGWLTIPMLRTRARRLKRVHGLGMIVVDYLQLMRGVGGAGGRTENRVQEISEITRGLKAVAKELQVPVLALSQLSRAVEARDDKRPQLSDLRESGSIEQDADVVMFVYREQYYLERAQPQQKPEEDKTKFDERHQRWQERCNQVHNVAEVIIAKQRHGPVGMVPLHFEGEFTRFTNLDPNHSLSLKSNE